MTTIELTASFNHNSKSIKANKAKIFTITSIVKITFAFILFEPRHNKTNKMTVRPAKTQISLGICPVWSESSLSTWRNLGSLATHWSEWVNAQADLWSDWVDAQAALSLCWVHSHFVGFVMRRLIYSILHGLEYRNVPKFSNRSEQTVKNPIREVWSGSTRSLIRIYTVCHSSASFRLITLWKIHISQILG